MADGLPLSDVKVLDLTRLLPGPFCTMVLADYGADVLKVEDTGAGDYIRYWPPYYGDGSDSEDGTSSASYLALNRNKKAMRLNLKESEGQQVLKKLAANYDVLIESFRPGVMERLGVGYGELKKENPGLIYCAISGYGQTGPYVDRAGHDMNYLSLNGLLGLTGRRGGPPIQSAGQIADLGGGASMALFGIMAALHQRSSDGKGQFVDISMTDGALVWLAMPAAAYFCNGEVPKRGELHLAGAVVCYFVYETADGGWVSLGALEPKFWQTWCSAVDRSDLLDCQFEHPDSESGSEVAAIFKQRTVEQWTELGREVECCLEPVLGLDQALNLDLFKAREMVTELDQPGCGPVKQIGPAVKFSGSKTGQPRPAPKLGEHTEQVLRDLGYSGSQIEALRSKGVV